MGFLYERSKKGEAGGRTQKNTRDHRECFGASFEKAYCGVAPPGIVRSAPSVRGVPTTALSGFSRPV